MQRIIFSCFIVVILTSNLALAENKDQTNCEFSITVGSGRVDGRYYEFVNSWNEFERHKKGKLCINNSSTEGSVENIALLERERIDFAIIQGDIGHHAFYGRNGYELQDRFSGVKPLYSEFVQIVVQGNKKATHQTISSLDGKVIAAGDAGAGGYWNAIDVLFAAGLSEGYNFQLYKDSEHPMVSLKEGRTNAAIYTSAKPHSIIQESLPGTYSFIQMPESASKKLSIGLKKSYYGHGVLEFKQAKESVSVSTISVNSYLVVSDSMSSLAVNTVKESVDEFVSHIKQSDGPLNQLNFIDSEIQDPPFDMHFMSTGQNQGRFLVNSLSLLSEYWLFIVSSILALTTVYARLFFRRRKYNSVGLLNQNSIWSKFQRTSFEFSKYTIGVAVWFIALVMISWVIASQEEKYADARGIDSPLEGFSLIDSVIWLVKTAFTTLPGEIPLSVTSSILIPVTVILGLGAFLHPVKVGYSAIERKNLQRANGADDFSWLSNHVVICGWNERTEGTILSLISKYTPFAKQVVVVADLGESAPLISKGFDKRRVHYVRGDASNTNTLRRAGAGYASEAIIVASDSNAESRNIGSVLTAVALSNLSKSIDRKGAGELFVCAELVHQDNKQAFLNAGVNAFVQVEDIADKIAAASAISVGVSDFIIDFLTFDNHFEIYNVGVNELPSALLELSLFDVLGSNNIKKNNDLTLSALRQTMVESGFQVLGKSRLTEDESSFEIELCNSTEIDNICSMEDRIVYFSVLKNSIDSAKWIRPSNKIPVLPKCPVHLKPRVLLIGDEPRLASVSNLIHSSGSACSTVSVDEVVDHINAVKSCHYINDIDSFSRVVIMENLRPLTLSDFQTESILSDTLAALIAKYLGTIRDAEGLSFSISSEVRNFKDRELYAMSGVNDVLVRNSLIERLIAKMMFNHGKMYDVIDKLVTLDNGVFLESYTVVKDDEFVGEDIKKLFAGRAHDYQICGWLPSRMSDYLKQNTMGIDTHWITALNSKTVKKRILENPKVLVGDQLMIVKIMGENNI